jgi:hypothetical protein
MYNYRGLCKHESVPMAETFSHPSPDELFLYQAEMTPIDDIERIEKHLLLCRRCRDAVETLEKKHPEPGALDLYAIGRLNGPVGNGIKVHLSHCRRCSETLAQRSEKVAQVRQGLSLLLGQGAAAHPELSETASKLNAPPAAAAGGAASPEEPPPAQGMTGFAFYLLGRKLGAVQNMTPGGGNARAFQTLSDAYDALRDFLDEKDLPLPSAMPIAQELSRGLREAMIMASEEGGGPGGAPANPDRLKTASRRFENALEDDLQRSGALPLETKATRELLHLVDHPHSVFPPQMWSALSLAAQHHWSEAARCLAYGLPTATAFHALRTLESVVNLYLERSGVSSPPPSLQEGLELLSQRGANPQAVELALRLTSLHGNLLHRADCFVSEEEGVDQFDLCTVAIQAFLRDMERRRPICP